MNVIRGLTSSSRWNALSRRLRHPKSYRRRDRLTEVFLVGDGRGLRSAAPWLTAMPGDAVFVGFDLRSFQERVTYPYGPVVGDHVLAEVGARLRSVARPWPVFRVGGDEFVVTARMPDQDAITAFVDAARSRIRDEHEHGVVVEAWAAAVCGTEGEDPLDLLHTLAKALSIVQTERIEDLLIIDDTSVFPFDS